MEQEIVKATSHSTSLAYQQLLPQLQALVQGEPDLVANMANIAAALHQCFGFWWVGFYRVQGQQLVLGPFQGPVACTRIGLGQGVCGTAWQRHQVVVVPNVHQWPGHIACSSATNSEIVLPIADASGTVQLVLDVDSEHLDHFGPEHQAGLQAVAAWVATLL